MCDISDQTRGPWLVGGDFNNVLAYEERIGKLVTLLEITEFKNCVGHCGLEDLKYKGSLFTWNNKKDGADRVFCKLDQIMSNEEWNDLYPEVVADFQPEGLFDHTPAVISLTDTLRRGKALFRYYNWWKGIQGYDAQVVEGWNIHIRGSPMFQLVMKLKNMNAILKNFNRNNAPHLELENRKADLLLKKGPTRAECESH